MYVDWRGERHHTPDEATSGVSGDLGAILNDARRVIGLVSRFLEAFRGASQDEREDLGRVYLQVAALVDSVLTQ
ncbi:MAG: hypothetical protein K6V73_07740 [Firmicutes bacterium]|nr:hypothetical protein [Bacillota bacterium]